MRGACGTACHRGVGGVQVEDVGGGVSTELREPEETKARHHGDQDTGEKERRRASRHPVLPEAEAAGADVPPAASERKVGFPFRLSLLCSAPQRNALANVLRSARLNVDCFSRLLPSQSRRTESPRMRTTSR